MIVDVHSHVWKYPDHFTDDFRRQAAERARVGEELDLTVRFEDYQQAIPAGEEVLTVVFGGKARLSGLWVEDTYVAECVGEHPRQRLGFLSVDPTQAGWEDELREGHRQLGLVGIKLLPMYAGFQPDDDRLDPLWQYASEHHLPVLLHTGTNFISQAPLEYTLPRHLDRVAPRFPDVNFILAHLGHPFSGECVVTIRKHKNLFADISAIHYRPYQFFQTLMLVQEYGVWDKVLFGTDYPFTSVDASVDGLRGLNGMVEGTNLPRLIPDEIEAMIYRDSLSLLGL